MNKGDMSQTETDMSQTETDMSQTEMDMSPNQRAVKYSRTLLLKEPKMHRLRLPSREAS